MTYLTPYPLPLCYSWFPCSFMSVCFPLSCSVHPFAYPSFFLISYYYSLGLLFVCFLFLFWGIFGWLVLVFVHLYFALPTLRPIYMYTCTHYRVNIHRCGTACMFSFVFLSFWVCLILLNIVLSRYIHFPEHFMISSIEEYHFYMYHIFIIHSSIDGHHGWCGGFCFCQDLCVWLFWLHISPCTMCM